MKVRIELDMPTAPKRMDHPCPVCFEEHDEDEECNMGVRRDGRSPEQSLEPTEYVRKVLRGGGKGVFRKRSKCTK